MVRSALPNIDLGHYELFLFVLSSITMFWSGGIKNAMFSWYSKLSGKEQQQFPWLAYCLLLILSSAVSIFIWLAATWIMALFSADGLALYWIYLCLYLVIAVPLVMIETVFFLRKEARRLLQYTYWSHFGLLILTLIVAFYSPQIMSFIYLLIGWAIVRLVYLFFYLCSTSDFSISWAKVAPFLVFSLPLIFNMLLGSAMDIVDGMFVSHFFDPSVFPVFRYGARELPLSGLLFSTLSVALIPTILECGSTTMVIRERATRLMHFLFPFSLVLMVLSPFIFPLVYEDAFRSSAYIFNIYLLIISSRVLLPQTFTLAFHEHKILIWSSVLEILVNVGLSFWWMQLWGIYGLAFATVVAYFVQKVILLIYNYRKYHIRFNQYVDVKYYTIYMGLLILTFILTFNFTT